MDGYEGDHCETAQKCLVGSNGEKCVKDQGTASGLIGNCTCQCKDGFEGTNCESKVKSPCSLPQKFTENTIFDQSCISEIELKSGGSCKILCKSGYTPVTNTSGDFSCDNGTLKAPTLQCEKTMTPNFGDTEKPDEKVPETPAPVITQVVAKMTLPLGNLKEILSLPNPAKVLSSAALEASGMSASEVTVNVTKSDYIYLNVNCKRADCSKEESAIVAALITLMCGNNAGNVCKIFAVSSTTGNVRRLASGATDKFVREYVVQSTDPIIQTEATKYAQNQPQISQDILATKLPTEIIRVSASNGADTSVTDAVTVASLSKGHSAAALFFKKSGIASAQGLADVQKSFSKTSFITALSKQTNVDKVTLERELNTTVKNNTATPLEDFDDPRVPPLFKKFITLRGFSAPTPIQKFCWPAILSGRDVIGVAETGSGKTLAYLLPAVAHIVAQTRTDSVESVVALILVPTRELATQVQSVCNRFRRLFGLRSSTVYGGVNRAAQIASLQTTHLPVTILTATPGRLLDLLQSGDFVLPCVTYCVVDEVDRMLGMGMREQIDAIFKYLRPDRQMMLFTASLSPKIEIAARTWAPKANIFHVSKLALSKKKLQQKSRFEVINPEQEKCTTISTHDINLINDILDTQKEPTDISYNLIAPENLLQIVHLCAEHKKQGKLMKLLRGIRKTANILIFCNTTKKVKELVSFLKRANCRCGAIFGQMKQDWRDKAMKNFKFGKTPVLVATDVAGRGLHIKNLRFVVNYDFPPTLEQYVHRIGRAGRAGRAGESHSYFTKNMSPLAPDLVSLLQRCGQTVDPNINQLAKKVRMKGHIQDNACKKRNKNSQDNKSKKCRKSNVKQTTEKKTPNKKEWGPCFSFQKDKTCIRGDMCRFQHT
eukprot:GSMAST32.ASY1.ANO1.87.1 assembled CDS